MNPYLLIIAMSGVVILSFFFNIISKKTNIPSVLLLIGLGMGIKAVMSANNVLDKDTGKCRVSDDYFGGCPRFRVRQ